MKKIYNKNGTLTKYALACGYIERFEKDINNRKTLELESIYHVKYTLDGKFFWNTFENLTDARKFYNSIKF